MTARHRINSFIIEHGTSTFLSRWLIRLRCWRFGVGVSFGEKFIDLICGEYCIRIAESHAVYARDIARRFEFNFTPIVPTLIDGRLTADYSKPALQTYRRYLREFYLSSFPEEEGAIEAYSRWYNPKPGDTVFDIGAHCGVSTYHFSKWVGSSGQVIAFEPDPLNYSLLLKNIELHGLTNVEPVNKAIAANNWSAAFHCEGTIGSGLARCSNRPSAGPVKQVETLTLADAFLAWGVPALCKIDIEGAEIEVITAAVETIAYERTQFVIDTNHVVDGELTTERIEKLFAGAGYETKSLPVDGMMTTWARPT